MRIVLLGAPVLAAWALLGCSSPSVPSWEVAKPNSRYSAEEHLTERVRPNMTSLASHDAGPSHAGPSRRKTDDTKIYNFKVDDPAPIASPLPDDDPRKALRELDRRQAEENHKVDAALAICRC